MGTRLMGVTYGDTLSEALVTKILAGTLVLALLAVIAFAIAPVGTGEAYTEFYVLGSDGTASGYPQNVTTGETVTLRVGIGNFENQRQRYTLVIRTDETTFVTRNLTLNVKEEWERPVSFDFDSPGRKHLRLELYLGQATNRGPYRDLQLFIDVRSQ